VSTVETVIADRVEELPRVIALVDALAAQHHLPADAATDMRVALDEVLVNIIRYAWSEAGSHAIRVRLTVTPDVLEAVVEDDGVPFDPLALPAPDLAAPPGQRQVGGLGVHFVRRLMTDVTYARVAGRNRLALTRRVAAPPEGGDRGSP
jgi:anti-sigma regulatory factor (Ser/Thr protein kinase)